MGLYGSNDGSKKISTTESPNLFGRIVSTVALSLTLTMMIYDTTALDVVVPRLQTYFSITDSTAALLQTLTTVTASVALIVVGAIGDRVQKRFFTLLTICLWILPSGLALFVPESMYWLFLFLRTIASIGNSILSSLAPVILSDFYRDRALARALVAMSLGIFFGSIISMSISSFFLTSGIPWQTALLPSIVIVFPLFLVLLFAMPQDKPSSAKNSRGYVSDVKQLMRIKSYTFLILAQCLGTIFSKTSAFWLPSLVFYAWSAGGEEVYGTISYSGVMTLNSSLALVGTFTGIPLFMFIAESWQYGGALCCGRKYARSIPLIAALLQILGALVTVLNILTLTISYYINLPCHFLMSFFGTPMGSILPQLVLTIAPRNLRATAYAILSLIPGLISSPSAQIAGMISDAYRGDAEDALTRFNALAFAFFILLTFFFAATIMYLMIVKYYPMDVDRRESEEALESPLLSSTDESAEEELMKRRESFLERSFASRSVTMDSINV